MNYLILRTPAPQAMERRTQTVSPFLDVKAAIPSKKVIAQVLAVIFIAFAIKYHYSTASVNGLTWILSPTAFLVELVSGVRFTFEAHAGYMTADHTFLIAASCSGVNFLIIAFIMVALGEVWRKRSEDTKWSWGSLPVSFAVAYVSTVIANTVRIDFALRTRQAGLGSNWLAPEEIHRLEGIVVYFGFLLLLFVLSEISKGGRDASRICRRLLLPLAVYYVTTLGIPIVTGAYREPGFLAHSLFVLATPLLLLTPFIGYIAFTHLRHRSEAQKHFLRLPIPPNRRRH